MEQEVIQARGHRGRGGGWAAVGGCERGMGSKGVGVESGVGRREEGGGEGAAWGGGGLWSH